MKLENPTLFHLLWALALQAVLLYYYWRWRSRTLQQIGSKALEEKLLLGFSGPRFWLKNVLFGLSLLFIVLAMVNPYRIERKQGMVQKMGSDVIIALDVSQSMLADDVTPSRMAQAKIIVEKLVQSLPNDRIGLEFFAGAAFPQTPLSMDRSALLLFVRSAGPDFITDQGTNIDDAIQVAMRLFDPNSEAGKTLIVLSDGENFGAAAERLAAKAQEEGIAVHTIAVGTLGGSNIPVGSREKLRDASGQVVHTRPDFAALRAIAKAGGGSALSLSDPENSVLSTLQEAIAGRQKANYEQKSGVQFITYFQWLVLPALLLLMVEQLLWWRKKIKN